MKTTNTTPDVWFEYRLPDGRRIHWSKWGISGRPIVLLHGLSANPRLYYRLIRHLVCRLGFVVYAPELPQHGDSSDATSFADMISMVVAWLESLELGRVLIFGHSLGGLVALALADARPDLVEATVAANSPIGRRYEHVGAVELMVRLQLVGVDLVVSTACAMGISLWTGHWWRFGTAVATGMTGVARLTKAPAFLLEATNTLVGAVERVEAAGIHQVRIFGGIDVGVPRAADELPGHVLMLPAAPHCSILFDWYVVPICEVIARVAGLEPVLQPTLVSAVATA